MLAPRRGCLGYSKFYCDVRKRWFLAWNQKRHIIYDIFHIQYTNSKISIGFPYFCLYFVWWHRLNHCAALVRNLPTSILVRALVCNSIRQPFWHHSGLRIWSNADSRTFLFPCCLTLLTCLARHGRTKLSNNIKGSQ